MGAWRKLILSGIVLSTVWGCGSSQEDASMATNTNETVTADHNSAIAQRAQSLLDGMSLEQKVAQMIQGEIKHVTPDDVRRYGLGSVLNGGGSFPANNKHSSIDDWVNLADAYREASLDTSQGSAGIPILWGTDAVHGHNNVIGATLFPHNIGLGAANDPELIGRIGRATAKEVAATGIDWIFAPTVAVVLDDRWGRTYEGYSDRPEIVKAYSGVIVEALQEQGLLATAKHFVGDGGTYQGIDQGNTEVDLEELMAVHGQGYLSALDAGVNSVMASFNSWNGDKIHGNKELLTGVLKGQLGFTGFVISDWNGVGQVDGCTNASCAQAINAGMDMIMAPEDWRELLDNTIAQVKAGEISQARIDDAVGRILRTKLAAQMFDAPMPSSRAGQYTDSVGSAEHRAIAREAVRKSLVLLKNDNNLLPLSPKQNVLVAGAGANSIEMQTGGWTISWQGTGNSNSDFPGATSIFDGLNQALTEAGGQVALSEDGSFAEKPDVAVVVFGETPYAEGQGDVETLAWQEETQADLALLESLKAQGIPVVAVLLTGRPLWLNAHINAADAFVVAWLPGSEGVGVADVLVAATDGSPRHDFSGRLSYDWPNKDLNAEDAALPVTDLLFEYGYGLSYDNPPTQLGRLNEQAVGKAKSLDRLVFSSGSKEPWREYVGDSGNWNMLAEGAVTTAMNGQLVMKAVDRVVQEDSRQLTWSGTGDQASQVYWQSNAPVDLSDLLDAGAALSVVLQMEEAPAGTVTLRVDCQYPCTGGLDVTALLRDRAIGEWQRVSIPLDCFATAGADFKRVTSPFVLITDKSLSLRISEISLLADAPAESLVSCPVVGAGD
jgi:beta-glucosidase